MTTDLAWLALPLPDEIQRMKSAGFLDPCRAAIQDALAGDLSHAMRRRLELELTRLDFLPPAEYPYTDDQAIALLDQTFADFHPEELDQLVADKAADWLYIDGVRRFHRRFVANILTTREDYVKRQKHPPAQDQQEALRQQRLLENIAWMKAKGSRTARLTLRHTFQLKPEAVRPGVPLTVHLPLPKPCGHQRDIRLLELSHPDLAVIAPEDAPQRTVCFPGAPAEGRFFVTYSYVNHLSYVVPSPAGGDGPLPGDMEPWLGEEWPHILFSPLTRALSQELQGGETDPLKKARNAYDYVTTKIKYSYMKEYAALDCICDYAAKNGKGDCGVQAILFITLCRLAGVPARWQSGFAADPTHVGCHDWAEFYVNPYGWLHADCSYGGSAWRAGDLERWNYYFGNLDIYRMVANSALQAPFTPPKAFFRADPTDNQRGEAEYPDAGVLPFDFTYQMEMLDLQEL